MRIALCEDNREDVLQFQKALSGITNPAFSNLDLDVYPDAKSLLNAWKQNERAPLLFMDIYLGEVNGVKLGKALREADPYLQIVLLSSSRDFGVEAFDMDALHYLIKPVTSQQLEDALTRYEKRSRSAVKNYIIRVGTREWKFPMKKIQTMRSHKKGVDVFLEGQSEPVHIPASFQVASALLDPDEFVQLSRGLSVAMTYIQDINRKDCRLKNGETVLLSRENKNRILSQYNDWLFRE